MAAWPRAEMWDVTAPGKVVCVTPLIVVSGCLAKPFGPVLVTTPVVRVT